MEELLATPDPSAPSFIAKLTEEVSSVSNLSPNGGVSHVTTGGAVAASERARGVMVFAFGALPAARAGERRGGALWVRIP